MDLIMPRKINKNKQLHCLFGLLLGLGLLVIPKSFAQSIQPSHTKQSIQSIREAARSFLIEQHSAIGDSNRQITLGKTDSRIQLVKCDIPLDAFFPQSSQSFGKTTVGVSCNGKIKWKLFISANVELFDTLWVTKRALSKNDTIQPQDLTKQKVRIDNLRKKPIRDLQLITYTRPTKRIAINGIIYEDEVCMVCQGDLVTVTASNSFFSISAEGTALANAKIGESIMVKNTRSKQVFTAIVKDRNELNVKLSGHKSL